MPKRFKKAPRVEYNPQNHYEHGDVENILNDTDAAGKIRALVTNDHNEKKTNPSHRLS